MPKIRNKIYKRPEGYAEPFLGTIQDGDDILDIQQHPNPPSDYLRTIQYGSEVVSSTLFSLTKDLLANDITLFNKADVASIVFSEGVFDLPRSLLTEDEEIELANLIRDKEAGWIHQENLQEYSAAEEYAAENRLNLLLYKKFRCIFLIDEETVTLDAPYENKSHKITVGPGKFKVYEEDIQTDGVYFIENDDPGENPEEGGEPIANPPEGVFFIDEISNPGYYRRDLISAVFRDTQGSPPYLIYEYGEEREGIIPKHTPQDKTLSETYGTFPLYSILYERAGGTTYLRNIDQIFSFSGFQSLVQFTNMIMFPRTGNALGLHSHKDLRPRTSTGDILGIIYGESQTAGDDPITGPQRLDLSYSDSHYQTILTKYPDLNNPESNKTIFPFILSETYNEYLPYNSVEFSQLELGTDYNYSPATDAEGEGIEINFVTAKRYATTERVSAIQVTNYEEDTNNSILTIDFPFTNFTLLTFDGIEWENDNVPLISIGDIVLIRTGNGRGQIGTIKQLELIEDETKTKITIDGKFYTPIDTAIDSSIIFFNVASETRAGFEITQSWLDSIDATDAAEYEDIYKDRGSTHTSRSILPYVDGGWDYELKTQIQNAHSDDEYKIFIGEANPGVKTIFPLKLRLNLNQWYFVKPTVARKTGVSPTYNTTTKLLVTKNESSVLNHYPYYNSVYYKNAGLYPGIDLYDEVFFQIYHYCRNEWVDIETKGTEGLPEYYSSERIDIPSEGFDSDSGIFLPPYWQVQAKNLDPALPIGERRPPERPLDPDPESDRVYDPTAPGIVYVDTLAGLIMFNTFDKPDLDHTSVTFYTYNTITGNLDTESIIHVVNPTSENRRNITLRSLLLDFQYQIENVEAEIVQTINYRGANSMIFIDDTMNNSQCGKVLLEPDPVSNNILCRAGGALYTNEGLTPNGRYAQEQQNPVSRKFSSRIDSLNKEEATIPYSFDITKKIEATFPSGLYSSEGTPTHNRVGFKLISKGEGYNKITVSLRNEANVELITGSIDYGDLPSEENWFYIELFFSNIPENAVYSYHLYVEETSVSLVLPTIQTAVDEDFSEAYHKFYYKPEPGSYYDASGPSIMRILDIQGNPLVIPRTIWDDTPGSDEDTLDFYPVDFSNDLDFETWEYEKYIGIDIFTGRIKFPIGLNPNNFYIEFNANLDHATLNSKGLKKHNQNYSLEDDVIKINYWQHEPVKFSGRNVTRSVNIPLGNVATSFGEVYIDTEAEVIIGAESEWVIMPLEGE